jgi:hypothetical protein
LDNLLSLTMIYVVYLLTRVNYSSVNLAKNLPAGIVYFFWGLAGLSVAIQIAALSWILVEDTQKANALSSGGLAVVATACCFYLTYSLVRLLKLIQKKQPGNSTATTQTKDSKHPHAANTHSNQVTRSPVTQQPSTLNIGPVLKRKISPLSPVPGGTPDLRGSPSNRMLFPAERQVTIFTKKGRGKNGTLERTVMCGKLFSVFLLLEFYVMEH